MKKSVLVSIVGDFSSSVLPVFFEYADTISKHIVIYDQSRRDAHTAKNLIRGMKRLFKELPIEAMPIDEDNLEKITGIIDKIEQTNKDTRLLINATDGMTDIATLLSFRFYPKGADFLYYDRFENTINILNTSGMQTKKLQKKLSIKEHFTLKNIDIVATSNKDFAKRYKNQIRSLFTTHLKEFKTLCYNLNKIHDNFVLEEQLPKEVKNTLQAMGVDTAKLTTQKKFITGDLFEYYIYNEMKKLDVDDVEVGLKVDKKISDTLHIANEFDVLVLKENHLHMIECKFKDFSNQTPYKKNELEKLIYKYSTLKHFLDDDGKNVLLFYKYLQNEEKSSLHHRARSNELLILDIEDEDFTKKIGRFLEL